MAKDKPALDAQDGTVLPERKTPDEWCVQYFPLSDSGRNHPDAWKHGAASALHGWAGHVHHAGSELLLSQVDYEAALDAACKPNPRPHTAALGAAGKA